MAGAANGRLLHRPCHDRSKRGGRPLRRHRRRRNGGAHRFHRRHAPRTDVHRAMPVHVERHAARCRTKVGETAAKVPISSSLPMPEDSHRRTPRLSLLLFAQARELARQELVRLHHIRQHDRRRVRLHQVPLLIRSPQHHLRRWKVRRSLKPKIQHPDPVRGLKQRSGISSSDPYVMFCFFHSILSL